MTIQLECPKHKIKMKWVCSKCLINDIFTPELEEKIIQKAKDYYIEKHLKWSDNWADCMDLILKKVVFKELKKLKKI